MEFTAVLGILAKHRIKIREEDGKLRIRPGSGALSPELRVLLVENKPRLLNWLRGRNAKQESAESFCDRLSGSDDLPLSFAQQRLWILHRLEGPNSAFNLPMSLDLDGVLSVHALERALRKIVTRHDILRTTFVAREGTPHQVVQDEVALNIGIIDLGAFAFGRDSNGQPINVVIKDLTQTETRRPFDLERGPVFRVSLLRLGPAEHLLLLNMHHIVSDGWSSGVLLREFALLYEGFVRDSRADLKPLPLQYAAFADWQRRMLRGEFPRRMLEYWRNQLQGAYPVAELAPDHAPPTTREHRPGATRKIAFTEDQTSEFKALCETAGCSLFMLLLASFQILLRHRIGNDDIIVGTDVANRNKPEFELLIGFFVNQLVMRTNLGGNPCFHDLLARVKEVALGAYDHQDLPFESLVKDLNPERELSRVPLYQVKLIFHNQEVPRVRLPALQLRAFRVESETSQLDMSMSMFEREGRIHGAMNYDTDLFEAETIERMLTSFSTILALTAANPTIRLDAIDAALTRAERDHKESKRRQLLGQHKRFSTRTRRSRGVSLRVEQKEPS